MSPLLKKLGSYSHVIWDWNGTLVNDAHLTATIVDEMMQDKGIGRLTLEQYRDQFHHPVHSFYQGLGFDCSEGAFDELCVLFNTKYKLKAANAELHSKVKPILAAVAASSGVQSILSAAPQQPLLTSVKEFGIEHYFDHIFGLDHHYADSKVQRGKELMAKVGVDPKQTALIGDTDHDHEVAEALGVDLVLVAHGHQSFERLEAIHPETVAGI